MKFGIWHYQIYIITFLCSFNTSPPESHPLPKIANNKKKIILPTRKVLENQFLMLKSKRPYFWQCSRTVVPKSRILCVCPNIGPYDCTTYQKAVCLWPKPYTWQHCFKVTFLSLFSVLHRFGTKLYQDNPSVWGNKTIWR